MVCPPLHFSSLVDVGARIRARDVTSVEVTRHMLDRIASVDPGLHSYTHVCATRALGQAAAADVDLDRGMCRGPLHGVPIAIKDLCYTTYAPTQAGMPIHAGFMAEFNATVVDRLELAGAVTLGKLTMTEGAYTGHHPDMPTPVNPLSRDHWVGTSSSGSGVATSAGLCFASLGSDTGGSIRYPSATCGLTGLKPTWGRVSRHGVFPLADTLDHVGPMTRNAADCAAMMTAIAGWDVHDPTSLDAKVPDYMAELSGGVRDVHIGVDRTYALDGVDTQVADAFETAVMVFEALGARIVDIAMPPYEELTALWIAMCAIETAEAHLDTYPSRASEYGPDLAQLIDEGHQMSGLEAARGNRLRVDFNGALATLFNGIDCLLCPTMPTPTPRLADMGAYGEDPNVLNAIMRYTAPFDFSGSPTVTLPNGMDHDGMPTSMQIVGPHLSEHVILRAAHAYQSVTDWHLRHPDVT